MSKSIYTTAETDKLIHQLKAEDPEFNLSCFVEQQLNDYKRGDKEQAILEKISFIKLKLANLVNESDLLKKELELWEAKHNKFLIEKEIEKRRKDEENATNMKRSEEKAKKDKERKDFIKSYFYDEMQREMTEEEYNKYIYGLENKLYINIMSFIREKQEEKENGKQ